MRGQTAREQTSEHPGFRLRGSACRGPGGTGVCRVCMLRPVHMSKSRSFLGGKLQAVTVAPGTRRQPCAFVEPRRKIARAVTTCQAGNFTRVRRQVARKPLCGDEIRAGAYCMSGNAAHACKFAVGQDKDGQCGATEVVLQLKCGRGFRAAPFMRRSTVRSCAVPTAGS